MTDAGEPDERTLMVLDRVARFQEHRVRRLPRLRRHWLGHYIETSPSTRRLGVCRWRIVEIGVLNGLTPETERRVLLHEMGHAATWQEAKAGVFHGPLWCQEMRRLASEHGEAWAVLDAARFAEGPLPATYPTSAGQTSRGVKFPLGMPGAKR